MITDIARGHIRVRIGTRTVTVQGEGYAPGYGSPDFVAYENSIRCWDPPDDAVGIDGPTKAEVLRLIMAGMEERNMTVEIE